MRRPHGVVQAHAFPGRINHAAIRAITEAAKRGCTVRIKYQDSKGEVTERETEPYEFKDDAYWGYCLLRKEIRRFTLEGIISARGTQTPYTPRWEVKIR